MSRTAAHSEQIAPADAVLVSKDELKKLAEYFHRIRNVARIIGEDYWEERDAIARNSYWGIGALARIDERNFKAEEVAVINEA